MKKRLLLSGFIVIMTALSLRIFLSKSKGNTPESVPQESVFADDQVTEESKQKVFQIMKCYKDIYSNAEKGDTVNTVLDDAVVCDIQKRIAESGIVVYSSVFYQNMVNEKKMDEFLKYCQKGIPGKQIIYKVQYDGGLAQEQYSFDGRDMHLFTVFYGWEKNKDSLEKENWYPMIINQSSSDIKDWFYSEKGWFGYQLNVLEPPEVTEIIDGSILIRVQPMDKKCMEYSRNYVYPIGYTGNNLLSLDWDAEHMEEIDYNGLFESFYRLESGEPYQGDLNNPDLSEVVFEELIMSHLPITREKLRIFADYDKNTKTYPWEQLGCMNYNPTSFGTSLPEVVDIQDNEDGTQTLKVQAVCDHVICDDSLITSELTIQLNAGNKVTYLSNHVISGRENIPEYRYRVR